MTLFEQRLAQDALTDAGRVGIAEAEAEIGQATLDQLLMIAAWLLVFETNGDTAQSQANVRDRLQMQVIRYLAAGARFKTIVDPTYFERRLVGH